MNPKLIAALTFLASRSRRFRKFMPLLTLAPVALAVVRWFQHRKARAQAQIEPPRYAERPGAYSRGPVAPSFR